MAIDLYLIWFEITNVASGNKLFGHFQIALNGSIRLCPSINVVVLRKQHFGSNHCDDVEVESSVELRWFPNVGEIIEKIFTMVTGDEW